MFEEIAHKAQISMLVHRVFPGRLIYCSVYITCPAHLCDHIVPGYFLWDYAQIEVCEICLASVDDFKNSEFGIVFKGLLKKCESMLQLPCHHGCRSVLSGMVVTDKVSCSNKNDKHKFSWTWNVPASVNNSFFHLALQCYFSSKTITCFCLTFVWAF